ncbi:MAG: hypothetical protein R3C10_27865 [Pirellulales bacterium]|nr:hypothetical protein [Planctomycetales bacterium]
MPAARTFISLRRARWGIAALLVAVVSIAVAAPPESSRPAATSPPTGEQSPVVRPPLEIGQQARVLLLGDAVVAAERADASVELLLRRSFPDRRLSFELLEQPGDVATLPSRPADLEAFKERVGRIAPTLVLVGVSVSADDKDSEQHRTEFREGFSQLLQAVAETGATTIVITPQVDRADDVAATTAAIGQVASELAADRSLRYLDLTRVSPLRAALAGKDASPYAHLAHTLAREPGLARPQWRVDVDVPSGRQISRGTTVSNLSAKPTVVRFTAWDDFLPATDASPGSQRVLRVTGLAPGRYTLRIDGEIVTSGRERDWQRGVTLREGPDFDQAGTLEAAVLRKNGGDGEPSDRDETLILRMARTVSRSYELSVD